MCVCVCVCVHNEKVWSVMSVCVCCICLSCKLSGTEYEVSVSQSPTQTLEKVIRKNCAGHTYNRLCHLAWADQKCRHALYIV